jgi:hypothetical protein
LYLEKGEDNPEILRLTTVGIFIMEMDALIDFEWQ